MRTLVLGLIAVTLGGCYVADREPVIEVYTRPEVDAINAETQCRALARNLVQIARCDVRR